MDDRRVSDNHVDRRVSDNLVERRVSDNLEDLDENAPLIIKPSEDTIPENDDLLTEDGPVFKEGGENGYGWVIVAVSFLCNFVLDGIAYSFGILLPSMQKDFNVGNGEIAFVGSVLAGTYLLTGPISAAACNRFGTRTTCCAGAAISGLGILSSRFCTTLHFLVISYGVIGGFGLGLMYVPSVVCVGQYFRKHLSLATGICVCGSGVGTFAFAPLQGYLVQHHGWRGCNMIVSCFCFVCIALGLLMVPNPQDINAQRDQKKSFNFKILTNPRFLLLMLGNIPTVMATYATFIYLPALAISEGLSADKASYLIACIGMVNTIGRVLSGWIADLPQISPLLLTMGGMLLASAMPVLFLFCGSYTQFLIIAAGFGLFLSAVPTATSAVVVTLIGTQNLNSGFGILTAIRGIAALLGPPIAGFVADKYGGHTYTFISASGQIASAGVITGIVFLLHKVHINRTSTPYSRL
jgi:predicted MFS family arabinose efflux permease